MKKRIEIGFVCALLVAMLVACDHDYESVFPETPDKRLNKAVDEYSRLLMSAPHGWKAALYTSSGAGYFYYFDFNDGGSVTMLSDFNSSAAGEPMVTDWTLRAQQRPTLSFTTYSYIHLPADPDGDVNNGLPGSGLLSDFEFAFTEVGTDTIRLSGLQHGSQIALVKATQAESEAYHDRRIQHVLNTTQSYFDAHRGYRLVLPGGMEVPVALSLPHKAISFQFVEEGIIQRRTTSFMFSIDGMQLKETVVIGDQEISKLIWDENSHAYYLPGDQPLFLTGYDDPFILQPSASLFSLLGRQSVTVAMPGDAGVRPLPGQSESFSALYKNVATRLLEGEYRLSIEEIRFVFIPNTDRMLVVFVITQPTAGGGVARFTAQYLYSYQLRDGDILKFKEEGKDQNGNILYPEVLGILSHFDNDTFTIEYIGGGFDLIAGFFSQEEPDYYFSGYLNE